MHKQCKQCGDYYYTTEKVRQFCSRACATIHYQNPAIKRLKPVNFKNVAVLFVEKCHLCRSKIALDALVTVDWGGEAHEVCVSCSKELSLRLEESGLSDEEINVILPTV